MVSQNLSQRRYILCPLKPGRQIGTEVIVLQSFELVSLPKFHSAQCLTDIPRGSLYIHLTVNDAYSLPWFWNQKNNYSLLSRVSFVFRFISVYSESCVVLYHDSVCRVFLFKPVFRSIMNIPSAVPQACTKQIWLHQWYIQEQDTASVIYPLKVYGRVPSGGVPGQDFRTPRCCLWHVLDMSCHPRVSHVKSFSCGSPYPYTFLAIKSN